MQYSHFVFLQRCLAQWFPTGLSVWEGWPPPARPSAAATSAPERRWRWVWPWHWAGWLRSSPAPAAAPVRWARTAWLSVPAACRDPPRCADACASAPSAAPGSRPMPGWWPPARWWSSGPSRCCWAWVHCCRSPGRPTSRWGKSCHSCWRWTWCPSWWDPRWCRSRWCCRTRGSWRRLSRWWLGFFRLGDPAAPSWTCGRHRRMRAWKREGLGSNEACWL